MNFTNLIYFTSLCYFYYNSPLFLPIVDIAQNPNNFSGINMQLLIEP